MPQIASLFAKNTLTSDNLVEISNPSVGGNFACTITDGGAPGSAALSNISVTHASYLGSGGGVSFYIRFQCDVNVTAGDVFINPVFTIPIASDFVATTDAMSGLCFAGFGDLAGFGIWFGVVDADISTDRLRATCFRPGSTVDNNYLNIDCFFHGSYVVQ